MIIYSVQALFTLRNEQLCSFVQQIFAELPLRIWVFDGVRWWKTKYKSFSAALKEFAVLQQAWTNGLMVQGKYDECHLLMVISKKTS